MKGKRIAVAVIWCDRRIILQLRDFRQDIADPGQWGLFGGHLHRGEAAESGLRRELREELGWNPDQLTPLGAFDAEHGRRHIVGFGATLLGSPNDLALNEGQELAAFTDSELITGFAHSRRWNRRFPLTDITARALCVWCRLSIGRRTCVR